MLAARLHDVLHHHVERRVVAERVLDDREQPVLVKEHVARRLRHLEVVEVLVERLAAVEVDDGDALDRAAHLHPSK